MRVSLLLALLCLPLSTSPAQQPQSYRLSQLDPLPRSNVVNDLLTHRDTVWAATGNGLSMTSNAGAGWKHFDRAFGFQEKGISAIAISDRIIWVAEASSQRQDGESIPVGIGLSYSTNRGKTWTHIPQPVEPRGATVDTLLYGRNRIPALAVTVTQNNLSYDLALTGSVIWSANFAGMLRKSTDDGKTWTRVVLPPDNLNHITPEDSLDFHLSPTSGGLGLRGNLNHRVFSVYASDDSTLWVGTAGGINKSTDGGVRWRKFSHQNQERPISGNFVVAIREQRWRGNRIVWASTVNAEDPNETRGLSFTLNGGESWQTTLLGERINNIAFKDSIVYAASDNGLFRSSDFGVTWIRSGTIFDNTNLQRFTSSRIIAVAVEGERVWAGGIDGLAYTIDSASEPFGSRWRVLRTFQPVGNSNATYSYPSPFSPQDEFVRIHYSTRGQTVPVTIRVFDFAMQPVRTIIQNAMRSGAYEHDEVWNGRDAYDRRVSNGVYFYRIEMEGQQPLWGKIFVVE